MESEKPYSGADGGVAPAGHKYHTLQEVIQCSSSSDSDSDYDYPLAAASGDLYPASIAAAAIAANKTMADLAAAAEFEESGTWELQDDGEGTLKANPQPLERPGGVGCSSSMSESSEGELNGEPAVIRQVGSQSRQGQKRQSGGDDKLYVIGSLNCSQLGHSDTEFAEEGIYQGLVMTNQEKEELGILPEAIYMTKKLMEKGELIESLMLSTAVSAVQVPEVPLPPNFPTLFKDNRVPASNTMPTSQPPAPRKKSDSCIGSAGGTGTKIGGSVLESQQQRIIMPRYRDLILRPPPLPPLESRANRAERRVYAVVDNLLKSEAAYLTSLNIAIQVYLIPLRELAQSPNPILSLEEVDCLFGPIEKILKFQEMFYSAITVRTLDWKPEQKIGDVLSSLSNKDVINNYSMYINNFTNAMTTLGNAINKKTRFVQFYKDKYESSRTSLSLQGLLLKPIQRFPQYIMFLQDLIKFTHSSHPDRVTLQLALARYEGITNFLNEHKRQREQMIVVQNLTHKVSHLPFKLTDGKRWLHRQDIVTRVMMSNGRLLSKDRCLLLFSNMILCAAMRRRKKKGSDKARRKQELESTTGSRDFETISDFLYTCKWYCPLDKLEVTEPDYLNDIWDKHSAIKKEESYWKLKEDYKKLEQDFLQVSHIATMAATLHSQYQGLSVSELATHVRILQRKIAKIKGELKALQHGRMDIRLPTREGDKRVGHTYIFRSEKVKQTWVNMLRYSRHKLNHPVTSSWVIAEDISDSDIFEVSYKLPLFVESFNLNLINNEVMSVQCGAKVGKSCAWLASGDNTSAQISIVECVTPTPLILECFKVNSKRILNIIYVPPSSYIVDTGRRDTFQSPPQQQQQQHKRKASRGSGSLTHLPAYLATVWMGAQCGRLSIFSADSSGEDSKQCLARITLPDAITSLQYYQDQVFAMTVDGQVVIFKRLMSGFNLKAFKSVKVLQDPDLVVRCTCKVGNKLWLAVGRHCQIFNMQTHDVEGVVHMTTGDHVVVNCMVYQGEGVWVSYKGSSSLELFHTSSKQSLQTVDVQTALRTIIKRRKLESRVILPSRVYVTSILASHGYLWIGTNMGCMLVYHIPYLDTVPIISGKPYLAMDSHIGSVRVLLPIHTSGTVESLRVKQFEDDESHRRSMLHREEELLAFDEVLDLTESTDRTMVRKRSSSLPPEMFSSRQSEASSAHNGVEDSPCARPGDMYVADARKGPESEIKRSSTITAVDMQSRRSRQHINQSIGFLPERQEEVQNVSPPQTEEQQGEEEGKDKLGGENGGKEEAGEERDVKESSGTGSEQSSKEEGERDNEAGEKNGEAQMEGEKKEEEDGEEDEDYNSDELESKEKFKNGIRPAPAQNGGAQTSGNTLENMSPKLRSFDVLAQESLRDSGDYTIPHDLDAIRHSAVAARYRDVSADKRRGNATEDPYSDPRELDAAGVVQRRGWMGVGDEAENPYDDPTELCALGGNGRGGVGPYDNPAELGMLGRENGRGTDGPYDDPTELGTMRKLSTLELINKSKTEVEKLTNANPYDFPGELEGNDGSVHPYEDPATLTKDVSTPSSLFSTKALNNSLNIPQRNSNVSEGAVFVLTAGRGLRNLRSGRKVSVYNQANKEAEACMMAYEIEL